MPDYGLENGSPDTVVYDVHLHLSTAWGGSTTNLIQFDDITWGGTNVGIGGTRILQIPNAFDAILPSASTTDFVGDMIVTGMNGSVSQKDFYPTIRLYAGSSAYKGGLYFRQNSSLTNGTTVWNPTDTFAANTTVDIRWSTYIEPTTQLAASDI